MLTCPQAQTLDQMAMVMSTLPLQIRHDFLKQKSKAGEGVWLDAVRLHGGFDLVHDSKYRNGEMSDVFGMVDAAVGFLENLGYESTDIDPVFGATESMQRLTIPEMPALREAYGRLVDHFVLAEAERERIPLPSTQPALPAHSTSKLHCILLVGAIAMDMRDHAEKLAMSCPQSVGHPFPKGMLGKNTKAHPDRGHEKSFTPYGLALLFSRTECLDVLAPLAANQSLPIALEWLSNGSYDEIHLDRAFEFPDHHFLPSTFAVALRNTMDRDPAPGVTSLHYQAALTSLKHNGGTGERNHLVPAYLAAGVYDTNPVESLTTAIEHGHAEIVAHFKGRIPWAKLPFDNEKESPLMKCLLEAQANTRIEKHQDTLVALIDAAIADGQYERVMHTFAKPLYVNNGREAILDELGNATNLVDPKNDNDTWGPVEIEPLTRIMSMGFDRVLVQTLDQGMDPKAPASSVPGSWTPQQMAEVTPGNASAIMRSYVARAKSLSLLDEMNEAEALRP